MALPHRCAVSFGVYCCPVATAGAFGMGISEHPDTREPIWCLLTGIALDEPWYLVINVDPTLDQA
jgi:hypothetical protein